MQLNGFFRQPQQVNSCRIFFSFPFADVILFTCCFTVVVCYCRIFRSMRVVRSTLGIGWPEKIPFENILQLIISFSWECKHRFDFEGKKERERNVQQSTTIYVQFLYCWGIHGLDKNMIFEYDNKIPLFFENFSTF